MPNVIIVRFFICFWSDDTFPRAPYPGSARSTDGGQTFEANSAWHLWDLSISQSSALSLDHGAFFAGVFRVETRLQWTQSLGALSRACIIIRVKKNTLSAAGHLNLPTRYLSKRFGRSKRDYKSGLVVFEREAPRTKLQVQAETGCAQLP